MEKLDINSSEHPNRDPYTLERDALTFPERLIELYLSDLLEENDISYSVRKGRARIKVDEKGHLFTRGNEYSALTKSDLQQAQIEAFYAKCAPASSVSHLCVISSLLVCLCIFADPGVPNTHHSRQRLVYRAAQGQHLHIALDRSLC